MEITGDHFVIENGIARAGIHILVDIWDAKHIRDTEYVKQSLIEAAEATNATIMDSKFHSFDDDGITGVVLLAESHISIHTWPVRNFAAIDIFTCGFCDTKQAIPVLVEKFESKKYSEKMVYRGQSHI